MEPAELLSKTKDLYDSFDPRRMLPDAHVEQFVFKHNIGDENAVIFLYEVFTGSLRYKKVIDAVITSFYDDVPTALRTDRTYYRLFVYLSLFRYEELGKDNFLSFLKSQDSFKIHVFFMFFLDESRLQTEFKQSWLTVFESDYVNDNLITPLLSASSELRDYFDLIDPARLRPSSSNHTLIKSNLPTTITKEFNLSLTKPRPPPEEEHFPQVKAHPIPETTYHPIKLKSHKAEFKATKSFKPSLSTDTRPLRKSVVLQELEDRKNREMTFKPSITQSKSIKAPSIPVRINTTALLREEMTLKKLQDEQLSKINDYEECLHDEYEFHEEVQRREQSEMMEKLKKRAELRQQVLLSEEVAKEAVENVVLDNRLTVMQIKSEKNALLELAEESKITEELRKREQRAQVISSRENASKAKESIAKEKEVEGQERRKEREENERAMALENERLIAERAELIARIRAQDLIRDGFVEPFDPTESSGCGLLVEMSLMELKERLCKVKEMNEKETLLKRQQIVEQRECRHELLKKKAEMIAKSRNQLSNAAKKSREVKQMKKNQEELHRQLMQEEAEAKLLNKLERKKNEKFEKLQKLKAEQETVARKTAALRSSAQAVEERKFKDLMAAQARREEKEREEAIRLKSRNNVTRRIDDKLRKPEKRRV
ncbi:hypothetical protein GEMRC1_004062 [Eukaryota sp. GEM-RC1]